MHHTTVADMLRVITREPGRPRITWYGDGGERVELSGAVLENWVNKTANLLVEEFDAGPGTRVLIDLPPHWRTVVWALSTWRVGACVVLGGGSSAAELPDVVVTDRPSGVVAPTLGSVIAVSLPALSRRFDGDLPTGSVDAASAVMTYSDSLGWAPPVDPRAPALEAPHAPHLTHGELGVEMDSPSGQPARRVLIRPGADRVTGTEACVRETLRELAADGSVVALDPAVARAHAELPQRWERLLAEERVTAVV
ncbi:TIGR03089 family protein [Cellulomonas chengniuliangii]|uniref:TIGR03089 family protein n=1 Tax=Cellulomonas chengniuliangii TaxID=2968084 RepID=UPI001D0F2726|nr:TIGR03089 family protein [Cellulomonas chengniuliangii]MCC2316928.1 TIGR03089 family protein [Cellulomonas chengniuliangii]